MAGQQRSRAQLQALESALKRAGISPADLVSGAVQVSRHETNGDGTVADGDYHRDGETSGGRARARFSSDFRSQTLEIAEDCARMLRGAPDRDTAQVYRSMIEILQRIEAADPKDPTPRPEDVRKGVVDMLAMLPDLCANDDELRTLAVEALARVVEQAEG